MRIFDQSTNELTHIGKENFLLNRPTGFAKHASRCSLPKKRVIYLQLAFCMFDQGLHVVNVIWSALIASRLMLLLILTVLFLINSGQGEELTASLLVVPPYSNWLLFLAIFAWAGQSWLWARLAIEVHPREQSAVRVDYHIAALVAEILPALYATSIFLLAILQFSRSGKIGLVSLIGVCSLTMFVGLFAWIYQHRELVELTGRPAIPELRYVWIRGEKILRLLLHIQRSERPTFHWWWLAVAASYGWSIAWTVVGIANPLFVAKNIGTLGTVFLVLSVLIPGIATMTIATRRTHIPTLTFLVLAPFLMPAL